MLLKAPAEVGVTVIRILLDVPLPIVPIVQAMLPPRLMHPGDADTNVTLLGRESVTATFKADEGPALAMFNV